MQSLWLVKSHSTHLYACADTRENPVIGQKGKGSWGHACGLKTPKMNLSHTSHLKAGEHSTRERGGGGGGIPSWFNEVHELERVAGCCTDDGRRDIWQALVDSGRKAKAPETERKKFLEAAGKIMVEMNCDTYSKGISELRYIFGHGRTTGLLRKEWPAGDTCS
jgi:hypothetical protein